MQYFDWFRAINRSPWTKNCNCGMGRPRPGRSIWKSARDRQGTVDGLQRKGLMLCGLDYRRSISMYSLGFAACVIWWLSVFLGTMQRDCMGTTSPQEKCMISRRLKETDNHRFELLFAELLFLLSISDNSGYSGIQDQLELTDFQEIDWKSKSDSSFRSYHSLRWVRYNVQIFQKVSIL